MTLTLSPDFAKRCAQLGCRFMAAGADMALLATAAGSLARLSGAGGPAQPHTARH